MGNSKCRRGGRRPGAGRKPSGPRKRVAHLARPVHLAKLPVHVTMRAKLGGLRQQVLLGVFARAIRASNARSAKQGTAGAAFRVVHYSLQRNHVHLLVEADDKLALSRGMQGLAARLALQMNRALHRKGPFWADRFHARDLLTTGQVRRALVYVLANHRKHERSLRPGVDPFSSGIWFRDWHESPPLPLSARFSRQVVPLDQCPTAEARTWLLASGWKRHGLISLAETPRLGTEATMSPRRRRTSTT